MAAAGRAVAAAERARRYGEAAGQDRARRWRVTAKASKGLFDQSGLLGRCVTNTLEPAGNIVVNDPFSTGRSNFDEFFFGLAEQAGESQNFDGNGQYLRLQAGGGPQLVQSQPRASLCPSSGSTSATRSRRRRATSRVSRKAAPPYRTDVPCYTQDVPNVNGPAAAAVAPNPAAVGP